MKRGTLKGKSATVFTLRGMDAISRKANCLNCFCPLLKMGLLWWWFVGGRGGGHILFFGVEGEGCQKSCLPCEKWRKIYQVYLAPLKAPYSSKIGIIQERFNKLIYEINTIIKCGNLQPVKFQLSRHSWNKMIFYRISELMLPKLIQRYDKNHFIFDPVQKREAN